jgi:hypothetical protein
MNMTDFKGSLNAPGRFLTRLLGLLLTAAAPGADLTFFGYSDTHYGAWLSPTDRTPMVTNTMVDVINALPGTAYPPDIKGLVAAPQGIVMPGDLINDGALADKYPAQWAHYTADFGVLGEGRCRFPVFEGIGNHDVNANLFVLNQVKARNLVRKKASLIGRLSGNGYHYSWDWEGVHFVNVNLFPGSQWHGEADAYGPVHDPMEARQFLEQDLRTQVGRSGRPVVVVQHYRPIDDNWWTHMAADRFHRVLQEYNIIAILVGHQGGGVNNLWRGINWISSNGDLIVLRITPDNEFFAVTRKPDSWGPVFKKKIFFTYEDSGLPAVIHNGDWASKITATTATLSGNILHEAVTPTQVTLYWGTTDGGTAPESWQHSATVGIQTANAPFHTAVSGLRPWTPYYYRCRAQNSQGVAWAPASIPFTTQGILPAGWHTTFIGYEQRAGSGATFEDGSFTVRGSGRDIGERGQLIDNFLYAYRSLTGDGEIVARITTMDIQTREPKVGIMLRETLDSNARNVALLFNPRTGMRLSSRDTVNGDTTATADPAVKSVPCWVRLSRQGRTLTGHVSQDGESWHQIGPAKTLDLPADLYAGLAVTAGNRDGSRHHTSTFDQVAIHSRNLLDQTGR